MQDDRSDFERGCIPRDENQLPCIRCSVSTGSWTGPPQGKRAPRVGISWTVPPFTQPPRAASVYFIPPTSALCIRLSHLTNSVESGSFPLVAGSVPLMEGSFPLRSSLLLPSILIEHPFLQERVQDILIDSAHGRFRAKRTQLQRVEGFLPASQSQNLALTVLHVPYSRDSGERDYARLHGELVLATDLFPCDV